MRINNNIMALNAHRQLAINQSNASKSMEKLSSGFRINRAGDDAAGLAISEKMRGQIRGLKQAQRNAQDGISLIQTAEGALNEIHAILQRMRELATQSATDTNTEVDRLEIQKEIDQLASEITRIADTTEFNTQNLLGGKFTAKFHIGANEGQNVDLDIAAMDAETLKVAESGVEYEVTGKTEINNSAGNPAIVTGEYEVISLPEGSEIDSIEYAYAIKDEDGKYVGVSRDGTTWEFALESSATLGSLKLTDAIKVILDAPVVSGTLSVEVIAAGDSDKGSIEVTGTSSVKFDAEEPLAAGKYSVEKNGDLFQLVNAEEEVVATSANGFAWVDVNGEALFKVSRALENGDSIEVVSRGIDVSSQVSADKAIKTINDALETVSAERSKLGAMQNRLEHTIANLGTSAENLQAAESRIRDLDMAEEIMAFTKNNILQQAATAMLAQANMAPQSVLQLLG